MSNQRIPRYAHAVVLVMAFAVVVLFFSTVIMFDIRDSKAVLLASVMSGIPSVALGYVWPGGFWCWGVGVSSGLSLFFGFVFTAFLFHGELQWAPMIDAITVVILASIGSFLGRRLSCQSRENLVEE